MTLDPRTPVFVGAGLVNVRDRDAEPIDVMARATEQALDDASSARLRRRIGAVRVVWGVWPYRDPGRLVAERIGASIEKRAGWPPNAVMSSPAMCACATASEASLRIHATIGMRAWPKIMNE